MDKYSKTRFNTAPTVGYSRTQFDLGHDILTTCNTGDLVPILAEPIYPGDTVELNTASLTRLETSIHQTMDNAFAETAFFFVPSKLIYDDFDKFMGANDDPWAQTGTYEIPQLRLSHGTNASGNGEVKVQSVLNQLGLPAGFYGPQTGTSDPGNTDLSYTVSAMFLRSYFQVFNDWYRDENFDSIVYFSKGGTEINLASTFLFNGSYFNPATDILKVNRFKDLFSTSLPAPQKGQDTTVNVLDNSFAKVGILNPGTSMSGTIVSTNVTNTSGLTIGEFNPYKVSTSSHSNMQLVTDLSNATLVTINQLRLAIVRQAMKERDARGGTRMNEKISSIFNVKVNDLEIGRSEFLGGKRTPISMMEVIQTSETGTTVLGTDAGHSKTFDSQEAFVKSFTQYGYLMGLMYMRTSRSYSQGIERKWFEKDQLSIMDPMLDNIGEIPVLKKELYGIKKTANNNTVTYLGFNDVWGYQEQYYWLKEKTNQFRGYFQSDISGTMDSWHYGDAYTSMPSLSAGWLKETPNNVDRTIAVSASISYQWTVNMHLDLKITRVLKKYSIPNTFGF